MRIEYITAAHYRIRYRNGTETDGRDNITLSRQDTDGCTVYALHAKDLKEPLDLDEAFVVTMESNLAPVRMTAMYMLNDWWTRPAFIHTYAEIPDRTQVLLVETEQEYAVVLPLVSSQYRAELIPGTENALRLRIYSGVEDSRDFSAPVCLFCTAESPRTAVERAMKAMAGICSIPLRKERRIPAMLNYLGWCSWDAFYRDVSAEGLQNKAKELQDKNIPVRWFLIDDGWLTTEGMKLAAYHPDEQKFPGGFHPVIEQIRKESKVSWFGVWHAVCGFWEGIAEGSELADASCIYRTKDGNLYPGGPHTEDFYQKWYAYLKAEGIDFVKVDGQSTVAHFFRDNIPAPQAARELLQSIERASAQMNHNVINCMGMAMESIAARTMTAVSRNSDDFVPSRGRDGFREHLLQNAYNSLYHNMFYVCDWDMFWTKQEDASMHALLRAASGGPVYFSDRVGETNAEVLRPLAYENGEVLRLERSLMPTDDCIFRDPLQEGVLKLHNYGRCGNERAGMLAVFNLTDAPQEYTASSSEIGELDPNAHYVIYDWFAGKTVSSLNGTLEPDEYRWYLFAPEGKHMAVFGRTDKYAGAAAVANWQEDEDYDRILLKEGGPFAWYTQYGIRSVTVNGIDRTKDVSCSEGLCTLDTGDHTPAEIIVKFDK